MVRPVVTVVSAFVLCHVGSALEVKRYSFVNSISMPISNSSLEQERASLYSKYRKSGYSDEEARRMSTAEAQATSKLHGTLLKGEIWVASDGGILAIAKQTLFKSQDGGRTWQKSPRFVVEYSRHDGTFSVLHGDPKTSELEINDSESQPWDQYDFPHTTGLPDSATLFLGKQFNRMGSYAKTVMGEETALERTWSDRGGVVYKHTVKVRSSDFRQIENTSTTRKGTHIYTFRCTYKTGQPNPSKIVREGLAGNVEYAYLGAEKSVPKWFLDSVLTMGPKGIAVNDARGGAHSATYVLKDGPMKKEQAVSLGTRQDTHPLNKLPALDERMTWDRIQPSAIVVGVAGAAVALLLIFWPFLRRRFRPTG